MAKIRPQSIKIGIFASAFLIRKLSSSSPSSPASESNAPPLYVDVVKLEECEEFDNTKREAKFAFRPPDLSSWNYSPLWSVVIYFPIGRRTYLFQAWKNESSGLLQAGRAEGVDYQVFANATYIGTTQTSPRELLDNAKQVSTEEYSKFAHDNQTWTKQFLFLTSRHLLTQLYKKIPATARS